MSPHEMVGEETSNICW